MITLKIGDQAPDFKAKNQDGKTVSLKDFRGQKIALYFYPEDDTPVCTVQACNFRDHIPQLHAKGYRVIGVSPQGVASHRQFADKYQLPFTLLADEEKKILNSYGVWTLKKLYGREYMGVQRATFVIDEQGNIEKIIGRALSKIAAAQVLK